MILGQIAPVSVDPLLKSIAGAAVATHQDERIESIRMIKTE